MELPEEGYLLRIIIGEGGRHQGKHLYEWIVIKARECGIAGATVVRGMMGYGANSRIKTSSILCLSEDLPVIIELIDTKRMLEEFLDVFLRDARTAIPYRKSQAPSSWHCADVYSGPGR